MRACKNLDTGVRDFAYFAYSFTCLYFTSAKVWIIRACFADDGHRVWLSYFRQWNTHSTNSLREPCTNSAIALSLVGDVVVNALYHKSHQPYYWCSWAYRRMNTCSDTLKGHSDRTTLLSEQPKAQYDTYIAFLTPYISLRSLIRTSLSSSGE